VLINAYLPSGDAPAPQKTSSTSGSCRLSATARAAAARRSPPATGTLWPTRASADARRRRRGPLRRRRPRHGGDFWQTCLGRQLVDAARHHKPNSRSATRFGHNSAARLDCWHIDTSAVGFAQPVGRGGEAASTITLKEIQEHANFQQ
jgi:hypothetical protein